MEYLAKSTAPAYICCNWHTSCLRMKSKHKSGSPKAMLLRIRRELQLEKPPCKHERIFSSKIVWEKTHFAYCNTSTLHATVISKKGNCIVWYDLDVSRCRQHVNPLETAAAFKANGLPRQKLLMKQGCPEAFDSWSCTMPRWKL